MSATHIGADPGHGGSTTHRGAKKDCPAPDCADSRGQNCSACGCSEDDCWARTTSCCDICLTCAGFTHDGSA